MTTSYLSAERAGKLLSLSLCLSLLAVSLAAPAWAQSRPGALGASGAGAVDPDNNKHEFDRGESIYEKTDIARVLRFQSVSRNKVAIKEFAALVVEYERLEKEEVGRFTNEAKRRELGLKKVALYDKYNISLSMLSVPKAKMPQYQAFWPNFWRRVDEFKKNNPGIQGPGPFTLPREGSLASLSNGVQSLAKSLGDSLAVQEAVAADFFVGSDFPACGRFTWESARPYHKCNNSDEDEFYFAIGLTRNHSNTKQTEEDTPYDGVITFVRADFVDISTCVFKPSEKKFARVGSIRLSEKGEYDWCGRLSGNAEGQISQLKRWFYKYPRFLNGRERDGHGIYLRYRYCIDSRRPDFEVTNRMWINAVAENLEQEPRWCDSKQLR